MTYATERRKVNFVVDADIRKFFNKVDQEWLLRFLGHRVSDKRVLRLIEKWLKAGVMQGNGRRANEARRKVSGCSTKR